MGFRERISAFSRTGLNPGRDAGGRGDWRGLGREGC